MVHHVQDVKSSAILVQCTSQSQISYAHGQRSDVLFRGVNAPHPNIMFRALFPDEDGDQSERARTLQEHLPIHVVPESAEIFSWVEQHVQLLQSRGWPNSTAKAPLVHNPLLAQFYLDPVLVFPSVARGIRICCGGGDPVNPGTLCTFFNIASHFSSTCSKKCRSTARALGSASSCQSRSPRAKDYWSSTGSASSCNFKRRSETNGLLLARWSPTRRCRCACSSMSQPCEVPNLSPTNCDTEEF